MSGENNIIIISDKIRELYAESIKNDKEKQISDLDNLVENKSKSVSFLSWFKENVDKFQADEALCCIASLWRARKEKALFREIKLMISCLLFIASKYDQKYEYDPTLESWCSTIDDILKRHNAGQLNKSKNIDVKFKIYFDLVDSIYDKYCSKVIKADSEIKHEEQEIKLVYRILYEASVKSNVKEFPLKDFLNFMDKNLAACNETDTKLPVLDRDDIYYIFEALSMGLYKREQGALDGSEVAKIFDLVSEAYKALCTDIKVLKEKVGLEQYNDGYGQNCVETASVLIDALVQAIKKGNVEKIYTKAVFELAIDVWKMLCETKTNRKSESLMYSVLNLIIDLLKKKNKSIDKAKEKLKTIGLSYNNNKNGWEKTDQKTNDDFWHHVKDYSDLISEIYKIYGIGELEEEIDNAAAAAPPLMENHNENNSINDGLNYYSDINDDEANEEVHQNNYSGIKSNENEKVSNNKYKLNANNGNEREEMIKINNDSGNNNAESESNIMNNGINPEIASIKGITDVQKINLDDQFKNTAIYWFNLFSIIFKLISFASLIVVIFSLISLLPQLAPVFAPANPAKRDTTQHTARAPPMISM